MRTQEITVYKFNELSDNGKENVLDTWRSKGYPIDWIDEIFASYEAVKDLFNMHYEGEEMVAQFEGIRAYSWLENNFFGQLRIPFKGSKRKELAQFGAFYRPGKIKPCPFTGYCSDEDFMDVLRDTINGGGCLSTIPRRLEEKYEEICQNEEEYQNTDAYIIDCIEANDYEFNEDGTIH